MAATLSCCDSCLSWAFTQEANKKIKAMKTAKEMTEDEQTASEKSVQELTDKYIKEVDVVVAKKNKEILEI